MEDGTTLLRNTSAEISKFYMLYLMTVYNKIKGTRRKVSCQKGSFDITIWS